MIINSNLIFDGKKLRKDERRTDRNVLSFKIVSIEFFTIISIISGVCQDKCVSIFTIRQAVRKGRHFYVVKP